MFPSAQQEQPQLVGYLHCGGEEVAIGRGRIVRLMRKRPGESFEVRRRSSL